MAEASEDKTLTPDDAVDVFEELLPAQTRSYRLGLKLKLPHHVLKAIHSTKLTPEDCLLEVIEVFIMQEKPRPTRRLIAEALRSPAVGMPALARKLESAHFTDLTSSRESVPRKADNIESSPGEITNEEVSNEINRKIKELEKIFNALKDHTMECLKKKQVIVEKVADVLTSISHDEDDQHKIFLENHIKDLFGASDVPELFGTMNFHWNYLNPPLLDHLVQSFDLEEVKGEMESYKLELKKFRAQTPLVVFCHTQTRRRLTLTLEFKKLVDGFKWPKYTTLETVEQFRQEYTSQYNLRECSMMVFRASDIFIST